MAASELHAALLRPAIIQIVKAMGYNLAKPSALDSIADLAARYLLLLASETAQAARDTHGYDQPTIQDIRMALYKVGALRPQLDLAEEAARGTEIIHGREFPFEDLRGVDSFVTWAQGPICKEIRRVAGLDGGESDNIADLAAGMDENEDYVTGKFYESVLTCSLLIETIVAIKKKHSKTAEDSKFEGTMLGKDADLQPVSIAGGSIETLSQWNAARLNGGYLTRSTSPPGSAISSALSTPVDNPTPGP